MSEKKSEHQKIRVFRIGDHEISSLNELRVWLAREFSTGEDIKAEGKDYALSFKELIGIMSQFGWKIEDGALGKSAWRNMGERGIENQEKRLEAVREMIISRLNCSVRHDLRKALGSKRS